MKFIAYKQSDNSIKIGRVCLEDGSYNRYIQSLVDGGMSETYALTYVAEKDKPEGTVSWRIADSTELPDGTEDGRYDVTTKTLLVES